METQLPVGLVSANCDDSDKYLVTDNEFYFNLFILILIELLHTCESLCHEGDCKPCSQTSNIYCRCGFKKKVSA